MEEMLTTMKMTTAKTSVTARSVRRIVPILSIASLLVPAWAGAHSERPSTFPSGNGSVPVYRTTGPELVVCKSESAGLIAALPEPTRSYNEALLAACAFEHIQDAVDAVSVAGSRILILPGAYREERHAGAPTGDCAEVPTDGSLSYDQHVACPHNQNLIAILGDGPDHDLACDGRLCNLQVEGTGDDPYDVLVDGEYNKLNVIRADRADGIYFRNFTAENADFNAVYVMETDGFVIDEVVARANYEYGFLTFTSDHGLYKNCEAYYNGDSGIYPGSAADLGRTRPSTEITGCNSHHNLIGISGTAGNSLYVHDNDLHHNSTGITLDSFFPHHPGLPQDSSTFINNRIYSNNEDYYSNYRDENPPCARKPHDRGLDNGVVCPSVPVPVGTGVMIAGGNANWFKDNYIYDNWRFGTMVFGVPAPLREEYDPEKLFDTSHDNEFIGNRMGYGPGLTDDPNGIDFWWDEGGRGNCWQDNYSTSSRSITSDPMLLPRCDSAIRNVQRPPSPAKVAVLAPCALWSRENHEPIACDWMRTPSEPY